MDRTESRSKQIYSYSLQFQNNFLEQMEKANIRIIYNNTVNQFHPMTAEQKLFYQVKIKYSQKQIITWAIKKLNKLERAEIIMYIFSGHKRITLEITNKKVEKSPPPTIGSQVMSLNKAHKPEKKSQRQLENIGK